MLFASYHGPPAELVLIGLAAFAVFAILLGIGTSAGLYLFSRRHVVWWLAPLFALFWAALLAGMLLLLAASGLRN